MLTQTENKTYNGWTNYETWAVKLWMDNEQSSYTYWQERTEEICRDAVADEFVDERTRARIDLAAALKYEHEDATPEAVYGTVFGDLLSAAMHDVNWHEIAEAMIDEIDEE